MNDPSFVVEVLKQVPGLAVLAWVVLKFLAHLRETDRIREASDNANTAAIKSIGDNCHAVQRELLGLSHAALARSNEALERHAEQIGRFLAEAERDGRERDRARRTRAE